MAKETLGVSLDCLSCSPHPLTIIPMYLMMIWRPYTRYQLFGKLPELIRESGFEAIRLLKKGLFLEYYLIEKAELSKNFEAGPDGGPPSE